MAVLILIGPPEAGTRFLVQPSGNTVIGRDPNCDITINCKSISRFHAQIISRYQYYYLEDSQSTNGTFINGVKVSKRVELHDGDRIRLHEIPMVFYFSNDTIIDEIKTAKLDPTALTVVDHRVLEVSRGSTELLTKLESFLEIARGLGSSFDTSVILPKILDLLFRMYPQAHNGEIHLEMQDGKLLPVAMKHGRDSDSTDLSGSPYNDQIVCDVYESGVGVIHTETSGEAESALAELHSIICMPIFCHTNTAFGCLLLETDDASHPFTETDRELVSAVAVLAGQGIGYARAHKIQLKHEHMARQLKTASDIQLSILPKKSPTLLNYQFAAYYSAAEAVGGDYYFYEQLPDNRLFVGIADASGKGLPAAMNIVNFAGEVRLKLAVSKSLKHAMQGINEYVAQGDLCSFITCCICMIDPKCNQVVVMNAGHMPPVVRRKDGQIKTFHTSKSGLPFGVDPKEVYHLSTYQLEPGDQVLMYTDGVSEAMNCKKELYGTDRLKTLMLTHKNTINETVELVVKDVEKFRNGIPPSDDTTIVAFEFLG